MNKRVNDRKNNYHSLLAGWKFAVLCSTALVYPIYSIYWSTGAGFIIPKQTRYVNKHLSLSNPAYIKK